MTFATVPLESVADVRLGRQRSPQHHSGDQMRPYVRAANVGWDGWLLDDVKSMNFTDAEMAIYRLEPGDLLLGEASGSAREVGKPAIWDGQIGDCAFQNTLIRVRPHGVDARYLLHYFKFVAGSGRFAERSRGVGIFHLGRQALADWPVPLPPLEEQRRIAAVLDAAEALRTKRRQALAKLDTLTQSIFIDMFGDEQAEWTFTPIEQLAAEHPGSVRTGPFGSQLLHEEFADEGPVAVLGIDNAVQNRFVWGDRRFISAEKYEQLRRYTVRPGDVLVTIMGTCGRVAIVPDDAPLAINTKHLCCITLDAQRCLPEFLWACLRFHPKVLRQLGATRGAVMPGLNMGLIKQAKIPEPPLKLQVEFARRKRLVEQEQSLVGRHQQELDDLFGSLQQRAFRGEL